MKRIAKVIYVAGCVHTAVQIARDPISPNDPLYWAGAATAVVAWPAIMVAALVAAAIDINNDVRLPST